MMIRQYKIEFVVANKDNKYNSEWIMKKLIRWLARKGLMSAGYVEEL